VRRGSTSPVRSRRPRFRIRARACARKRPRTSANLRGRLDGGQGRNRTNDTRIFKGRGRPKTHTNQREFTPPQEAPEGFECAADSSKNTKFPKLTTVPVVYPSHSRNRTRSRPELRGRRSRCDVPTVTDSYWAEALQARAHLSPALSPDSSPTRKLLSRLARSICASALCLGRRVGRGSSVRRTSHSSADGSTRSASREHLSRRTRPRTLTGCRALPRACQLHFPST
jgi:hypothetical protein